jgi:signal transduction histidine kinase
MKVKMSVLSKAYQAALRENLKQLSSTASDDAVQLGVQAVLLGLETLDMAHIHEEALVAMGMPHDADSMAPATIRQAGAFFAAAISPIEEVHRSAREANVQLKIFVETLNRRTEELATANQDLKDEIVRREGVEGSLRTSELTLSALLENAQHMQEELRHLSRRLLTVQEEERKRISRELHDVVAQTLTGITLRLATMKMQTTANAKDFQKKIAVTQRLVESSVDVVHRFARDLRPAVLDDLGLIPALEGYVKRFIVRADIDVDFKACAEVEELNNAALTVLYRVAQESLTNVARHANASHVEFSIENFPPMVRMEIRDDGMGFQVDGADLTESSQRLGLLGMRERLEMAGGTLCVKSALGQGTTIRAELPKGKVPPKSKRKKSGNTPLECP